LNNAYNLFEKLGQLAREYDRKHRELEQLAEKTQPRELLAQLSVLAERTTDRFRTNQQELIGTLNSGEDAEQGNLLDAVMTLSSCFDEMRILFQVLHRLTLTSSPRNRAGQDA
jgi:hypothetical protein